MFWCPFVVVLFSLYDYRHVIPTIAQTATLLSVLQQSPAYTNGKIALCFASRLLLRLQYRYLSSTALYNVRVESLSLALPYMIRLSVAASAIVTASPRSNQCPGSLFSSSHGWTVTSAGSGGFAFRVRHFACFPLSARLLYSSLPLVGGVASCIIGSWIWCLRPASEIITLPSSCVCVCVCLCVSKEGGGRALKCNK